MRNVRFHSHARRCERHEWRSIARDGAWIRNVIQPDIPAGNFTAHDQRIAVRRGITAVGVVAGEDATEPLSRLGADVAHVPDIGLPRRIQVAIVVTAPSGSVKNRVRSFVAHGDLMHFCRVGGHDVLQINRRGWIADVENFHADNPGDMRRFVEKVALQPNRMHPVETVGDIASGAPTRQSNWGSGLVRLTMCSPPPLQLPK